MFDPSKLNLDPENIEKDIENTQKNTEDIQKDSKKEVKNDLDIKDTINIDDIDIKKETISQVKNNIIFNISINSLQDILILLADKEYDFVVIEPETEAVKISFKKDKIEKETFFIKYPIYSKILIKAKILTHLKVDEAENTQEWTWEIRLKSKTYKLISKTIPNELWDKLFLKLKLLEKKLTKQTKKLSLNQILWFLWAIAFISLILWWTFLWFIALNAKTVEDVEFFRSLGINLNDIKDFVSKLIIIIFSILLFIETIFLVVFLFKFSLTKKEYKQKRIRYWIISVLFLIFTVFTTSIWMVIDKQIKTWPNWQEMAYWDIQLYDNSKLISEKFDKWWSIIKDTSNMIWPVVIKFDLNFLAKKEQDKWHRIKKYIWDFWEKDMQVTSTPTIIKKFSKKWNHEISLIIETINLEWQTTEKKVENIPNINISYVVTKSEKQLKSWWKLVSFDAKALKELWKIEWYFTNDLTKPVWKWYTFKIWTPIFKETIVWMYIKRNDKTSEALDKIFIVEKDDKSQIFWEIISNRGLVNDLEFDFHLENIENDFWEWFIEEYKWIIEWKEITKAWSVENPSESSKIKYTFKNYWKHNIKVILKNSDSKIKEISTTIDIPQNIKLKNKLRIKNNDEVVENVKYEPLLNEYYINEIWIPTKIVFDARFVRADNLLYTLKQVNWDFDSNWDIDKTKKTAYYDMNTTWNHTISVEYIFAHREITDDIIKLKEKIFIEWVQKEAILNLKIEKTGNYAPSIVKFDASRSIIKDEDIAKFVWDFGDWIVHEWDAIVSWHKYSNPGVYSVVVKIVTESWKEFTTSKTFTLSPKPQSVKIDVSMKKTLPGYGIDFSSTKSQWQIVSYLWDFGDKNVSTEANPTHSYRKPWKYTVTLKVDFANNNVLEDKIEIEILEDE